MTNVGGITCKKLSASEDITVGNDKVKIYSTGNIKTDNFETSSTQVKMLSGDINFDRFNDIDISSSVLNSNNDNNYKDLVTLNNGSAGLIFVTSFGKTSKYTGIYSFSYVNSTLTTNKLTEKGDITIGFKAIRGNNLGIGRTDSSVGTFKVDVTILLIT